LCKALVGAVSSDAFSCKAIAVRGAECAGYCARICKSSFNECAFAATRDTVDNYWEGKRLLCALKAGRK